MEDNTEEMSREIDLEMDLDGFRTNDSQALPNTQSNRNSRIDSFNQQQKKSVSNFVKRPRVPAKKE